VTFGLISAIILAYRLAVMHLPCSTKGRLTDEVGNLLSQGGDACPSLFLFSWRSTMKNALGIITLVLLIAARPSRPARALRFPSITLRRSARERAVTIIEFIDFQ